MPTSRECPYLPQSRRAFVRNASLAAAAALGVPPWLAWGQPAGGTASLTFRQGETGPTVPRDFVGLSYENMQLEDPAFFSASNRELVARFREISPTGVLRLGGNTSEFGWWKAKPSDTAPKRIESPWKAAGEPTAATVFAITPEAIDNLAGFLEATGWTCIYGLNLGYGTPETDLPEAIYVSRKLGKRLQYFQVGNEVDLFRGHLRNQATWNVESYLQEWLHVAQAVQKALPDARFGMPDVAVDVTWLSRIAGLWGPVQGKPNLVTMSHHYYWSGPPANPDANITNLLQPDPKVASYAAIASAAAQQVGPGVTWRMTEGNTIYRGGKDGVSDVFASALWSADYLLRLMSLGYCGVNLHGGSGHAQAVSVGGVFHGEALMKDPNAPHPKPFYTPIANEGTLAGAGVNGKLNDKYILEPVGFGMKFAALLTGGTMLPLDFRPGGTNATAYAARKGNRIQVAVLNKDATQPLSLALPGYRLVATLTAPALDRREAALTMGPAGGGLTSAPLLVSPHSAVLVQLGS